MTDIRYIYRNNGHWLRLLNLVDQDSVAVTNATVTANMTKKDGSAIGGIALPLTLTAIGATNSYEVALDASVMTGVAPYDRLRIVISIDAGGIKGELVRDVVFNERLA